MSDKKKYTVKTPNTGFTGQRFGVQFERGEGQATKDEANVLVKRYGYTCAELYPDEVEVEAKAKVEDEPKPITDTIGGEEVHLVEYGGVLYAHPENTNAALKAFMEHQEIDIDSNDIKEDLNEKIAGWLESQSGDEG